MGAGTELIFVEGGSKDDTWSAIEREIARRPNRNVKLFRQEGTGKGDAVRKGFSEATGEVLMILDADLTVPPEDLPGAFTMRGGAVVRSDFRQRGSGSCIRYAGRRHAWFFCTTSAT